MSKTVVVVPWWPDTVDPQRVHWRDGVVALWISWGLEVVLGVGAEGAARNRGIEEAVREYGATEIVVCDADSIITRAQADEAILMARAEPGLVVPHDRYVYLGEQACFGLSVPLALEILEGHDGRWPFVEPDTPLIEFAGENGVGGPTVFSVETWRAVSGYDEEIVRAYDGAFALATGTLVAPQRRLEGDYIHFWHPRPEIEDPPETWALIQRYHDAAKMGPQAMRNLLAR